MTSGRTRSSTARATLLRSLRASLALLLLALALDACGATATSSTRSASTARYASAAGSAPAGTSAAPCGAAAGEEAAKAAGVVGRRIYALELASAEVRSDQRQVEGYEPLLAALAAGDRPAVEAAVTSLVYSHTHVVRLRVSAAGAVVADVGGPYILAPVGGSLRYHGRTVGRYLLSVQDDSGYQKLEQRYIGAPLIMRIGSRQIPVEGTLPSSAGSLPTGGRVTYHGASYQLVTLHAHAFPAGTLSISLLIAAPSSSSASCSAVIAGELDRIGERVWHRFSAVGAPPSAFVHALGGLTGALAYVRAGSTEIAGSTRPGPRLRDSGTVRYRGKTYVVASFPTDVRGTAVRVYQLLPG
ncbi:MAG TPA: hypothetical protein VKG82_09730 [Solirubrobacteraceae bacterium]|nr:hypothetical protein [Solirubrobacteraceae bacterium]